MKTFLAYFLLNGFVASALAIVDPCDSVNVSETQVSEWMKTNAPTYPWDRPLKNGLQPIRVIVGLHIKDFARIVSSILLNFTYII